MIVLLCGPSGSGKTTLLKLILAQTKATIIDAIVSRSRARECVEPGKREVAFSEFNNMKMKSDFQYLYRYNDSVYGYSLEPTDILSKAYVFLDYPGDYPECHELCFIWKGILVLPPDRSILIKRLKQQGKEHRIPSALMEYDQILVELHNGRYKKPTWRVFHSNDSTTNRDLIEDINSQSLFS
jgi:ribose 1,5-bisphosphokinase PhnN